MQPRERGGTTVMARPGQGARSRAPQAPGCDAPRRPGGDFDLAAWVQGVMRSLEETPCEPFKQGLVTRSKDAVPRPDGPTPRSSPRPVPGATPRSSPRPTAQPPGSTPRRPFDLTAWVYGLVPRHDAEEPEPAPVPRRPPAPRRKALTMPDLFEQPAVPPCLRDDD